MQVKDTKFDIVVERAPCLSGEVALAGFVAKCDMGNDVIAEGKGATKADAVDACEKAILGKLLGPAPVAAVEAAPVLAEPKKKAAAKAE